MAIVIDRQAAAVRAARYPNDPELLSRVLRPYRAKNCEYLRSVTVTMDGDAVTGGAGTPGGLLTAACEFEIAESCYIDDTGHFNAVEFNICYNQMAYYVLAKSVQEGLMEPFSQWSIDDFWERQLSNILITDFRSSFRSAMSGQIFHGELKVLAVTQWDGSDVRDPLISLRTECRYWDEHGGECRGDVSAAITNPPQFGS
jgi:FcoT-like thioesterase domain